MDATKLLWLKPNLLSSSFYNTTLGLFGLDGYVLLTKGGDHFIIRVLNRVSVSAVRVDEEQSIVTFLVPPFFPQVFSMYLRLKANLILYAK